MAEKGGKPEILQKRLELAEQNLTIEEGNKFLLVTDNKGRTVNHMTTEGKKLYILQEISKYIEENVLIDEINNKLIFIYRR